MPITPQDIQNQTFAEANPGYDPRQVDVFLEHVAKEIHAMVQKIADLKQRLTMAENQLALGYNAQQNNTHGASPDQISAALIMAQQSADKLMSQARAEADKIREEADARSREIIRQALQEKQDEVNEIERLKVSREDFRASYLKLIEHFQDEANAVFPDAMLIQPAMPEGAEQAADPVEERVEPQKPAMNTDLGLDDLD